MEVRYLVNEGFDFAGKIIRWDEKREIIREKLASGFEINDREYEGIGGEISYIKRDIYKNYKDHDNFFFLNYSEDQKLQEVEFHWGFKIIIGNIVFQFDQEILLIVDMLDKAGYKILEVNSGEFIVPDIKLTFMDANNMGGEGTGLAYLYSGSDISHVLEEYEQLKQN